MHFYLCVDCLVNLKKYPGPQMFLNIYIISWLVPLRIIPEIILVICSPWLSLLLIVRHSYHLCHSISFWSPFVNYIFTCRQHIYRRPAKMLRYDTYVKYNSHYLLKAFHSIITYRFIVKVIHVCHIILWSKYLKKMYWTIYFLKS